ncbi:MAG: aspartyl-tRNA(Asn)/glutamyl-tRNA(Gln) amidotransferase subunit C [Candidatus Midichloriaceae bacterium]|jgi:aspartyl-tRNA(Asn)/glutamyl-tRNA(Gln) amidotransferase subunit C
MMYYHELEVKKIAKLSSLSLSQDEEEIYQKDLGDILKLFDQLKEVNTDDVKPLCSVIQNDLVTRKEFSEEMNSREDILNNAPKSKYGYFVVPKMIS